MKDKILPYFLYPLYLACGVLGFAWVQNSCRHATDGFAYEKIFSDLRPNPDWEMPTLSEGKRKEFGVICDQPFHYLARGAQSFAFVSADGRYVIKFFRFHRLSPPFWATHLKWPFLLQPYRLSKLSYKNRKIVKDFASYKLAFDLMPEETGMLFLHLNKSHDLNCKLTIYDRLNIAYKVDLDQVEFLIQKKGTLLYPGIAEIMESNRPDVAKQALSELIHLLVKRCKLGIEDKDPNLNTNFGLIDSHPFQLDTGRFTRKEDTTENSVDPHEIINITDNLHQWLESRYPVLDAHLHQLLNENIN